MRGIKLLFNSRFLNRQKPRFSMFKIMYISKQSFGSVSSCVRESFPTFRTGQTVGEKLNFRK